MKKNNPLPVSALIILLLAGGALYFFKQHSSTPVETTAVPLPVGEAPAQTPPLPSPLPERYPIPTTASGAVKTGLPKLEESDSSVEEALSALIGKAAFEKLFQPTELIRRLVVSIDNAKEPLLPLDLIAFRTVSQSLKIRKKEDQFFLDPLNFQRYTPYVKLAENTNLKKAAEIYFHFYPLFQSAYLELNPHGHFNDRLIEILDHLISTPPTSEIVELISLNKAYHFSDPNLEHLSVTQKILIRMGPSNAEIVKAKLRSLRNIIILGR